MRWGVWSAICYPILYACCNVLLLPGGVLSIGGGFFFGLWWGFLIVLIGNVTGAAISFFIGRTIGRRWLERRLEKSRRLHALEPAMEREGWKLILLSQLHPLFPSRDRKSTRLNSSHLGISYAVFCLKKKKK